jgi:hypothetical protein
MKSRVLLPCTRHDWPILALQVRSPVTGPGRSARLPPSCVSPAAHSYFLPLLLSALFSFVSITALIGSPSSIASAFASLPFDLLTLLFAFGFPPSACMAPLGLAPLLGCLCLFRLLSSSAAQNHECPQRSHRIFFEDTGRPGLEIVDVGISERPLPSKAARKGGVSPPNLTFYDGLFGREEAKRGRFSVRACPNLKPRSGGPRGLRGFLRVYQDWGGRMLGVGGRSVGQESVEK